MLEENQWVSVEDHLPNSNELVLVCRDTFEYKKKSKIEVAKWSTYNALYGAPRSVWVREGSVIPLSGVTHWMYLPDAPTIPEEFKVKITRHNTGFHSQYSYHFLDEYTKFDEETMNRMIKLFNDLENDRA